MILLPSGVINDDDDMYSYVSRAYNPKATEFQLFTYDNSMPKPTRQ